MNKKGDIRERLILKIKKGWKKGYENKDFDLMEKEMKNINKYLEKIMPLENIIKEARLVENVHNLIKNNNKNFEINEVELEAANVLA